LLSVKQVKISIFENDIRDGYSIPIFYFDLRYQYRISISNIDIFTCLTLSN